MQLQILFDHEQTISPNQWLSPDTVAILSDGVSPVTPSFVQEDHHVTIIKRHFKANVSLRKLSLWIADSLNFCRVKPDFLSNMQTVDSTSSTPSLSFSSHYFVQVYSRTLQHNVQNMPFLCQRGKLFVMYGSSSAHDRFL